MLLAIDIGNSAVKGAFFDGTELRSSFRIPHSGVSEKTLRKRLREHGAQLGLRRIAICSVVPGVERVVRHALEPEDGGVLLAISHRCRLPIRLGYQRPSQLGPDRIAAAVGAQGLARGLSGADGRPIVAIDAGTAVTFNVIDSGGTFVGGAIWAGPDLVLRALHEGTAELPDAALAGDVNPISSETGEAVRSGTILGFIEGARGILNRIESALGDSPVVIVTGGRAELLSEGLDKVDVWSPHLVLEGVRVIADLNRTESSPS